MAAKKGGEEKYPSCGQRGRVNPHADVQTPQHNLKAHRHVSGQKDYGCESDYYIVFNIHSFIKLYPKVTLEATNYISVLRRQ